MARWGGEELLGKEVGGWKVGGGGSEGPVAIHQSAGKYFIIFTTGPVVLVDTV